jgi:hypothetical protein
VHSDCDIEVEDVCLVESEDDIVKPTNSSKTSTPITRSKTVESSFPTKSNQSVVSNSPSLKKGAALATKNLALSIGKTNVVIKQEKVDGANGFSFSVSSLCDRTHKTLQSLTT